VGIIMMKQKRQITNRKLREIILTPQIKFPQAINEKLNETLPFDQCIIVLGTLVTLEKCGLGNYSISHVCDVFSSVVNNSRKTQSFFEELFR
jgi:hypothetical protein